MGAEYYLFALFIFGLAAMLVFLFIRGSKKNKLEDTQGQDEREQKIMMLYFEVEDMINALKEYVEVSKERIQADIDRIETDMQAVKLLLNHMPSDQQHEKKAAEPMPEQEVQMEPTKDNMETLRQQVILMSSQGESVEQIAQKLGLSKGEVAFMVKLNQNNRDL